MFDCFSTATILLKQGNTQPLWITAGLALSSGVNMAYATRPEQQEGRAAATGIKLVLTFSCSSLRPIKRRGWWEDTLAMSWLSGRLGMCRRPFLSYSRRGGRGLLLGPDRSMLTTTLPCSLWKRVGRRKQEGGCVSWMSAALIQQSCYKQCFALRCSHEMLNCECKLFRMRIKMFTCVRKNMVRNGNTGPYASKCCASTQMHVQYWQRK